MSRHSTHTFAAWVVDTLQGGDVAVALGGAPDEIPVEGRWAAVYPIAGGIIGGSIDDLYTDATPDIQITSVSYYPEQTLWLVDRIRNLILDAIPATLSDGRRVIFGEPSFADPTLLRDNDVDPPTWYSPDRLSFRTA